MKRFFLIVASLLLSTSAMADAPSEQPKNIPLDQIWGYNLPGTRDIAGIPLPESDPQKGVVGRTDEQFRRQREHSIEQIRSSLAAKPPTERASPGFVIPRQPDFFTLQKAVIFATGTMRYDHQKLLPRNDTFRAGDEMTLVFFSHPASYFVRLREVVRNDNEINVKYEFEPHTSPEVTTHFALIPLGKLPAGEYKVRFEQQPLAKKFRDAGFQPVHPEAPQTVSQPLSFTVWEPASPEPAKGASLIPLDQIWAYDMPRTRDVRELEPKANPTLSIEELTRRLDVWKILKVLKDRPSEGETAGSAFVVLGVGKEALKNAEAVFSSGKDTRKVLPADTELSLVFYSYMCGRYVRLVSVERSPNQITVKYQFVAHQTENMSTHFALIPLGKLSAGTFQVKIEQLEPIDEQGRSVAPISNPQRLVCDSFSFDVQRE